MIKKKKFDPNAFIQSLMPRARKARREEGLYNLRQYLTVVLRIHERLQTPEMDSNKNETN